MSTKTTADKDPEKLEATASELRDEIRDAMKSGAPSLDARKKLAEVQDKLTSARNATQAEQSRVRDESASRASDQARCVAGAAAASLEQELGQFGLPAVPDLSRAALHPAHVAQIESCAANVALAEQRHEQATAAHRAAQEDAEAWTIRVAEVEQRMNAITAKRIAGDASVEDANEYAALYGDVVEMRRYREQASQKIAALVPNETAHAL